MHRQSWLVSVFLALGVSFAQAETATVPFQLDHNRIVIEVQLPLADGSMQKIHGWVDPGNPDLWISEAVARASQLEFTAPPERGGVGLSQARKAKPPDSIFVGGMKLPLGGFPQVSVILADSIAPGLPCDINLPSTLLRNYDVRIDFPRKVLTLGSPGTLEFSGVSTKSFINETNGLIQLLSQVGGESCHLGLDPGASISFLAEDLIRSLKEDASNPTMKGAIADANLWGYADEPSWELMRVASLQFGAVRLADVVFVSIPADFIAAIGKRGGIPTAGLIGSNALLNQRIGIDYAKQTVYFEPAAPSKGGDTDVIGLVLRPQPDGSYTVLGVPEYEGTAAVPDVKAGDILVRVDGVPVRGKSMGEVWSLLQGTPGDTRTMELEREGELFAVRTQIRRFLKSKS